MSDNSTSVVEPSEAANGQRGIRAITVVAIIFIWFPILNIVLAHAAEIGEDRSGNTNSSLVTGVKIVAYLLTLGFLIYWGSAFADLSAGP